LLWGGSQIDQLLENNDTVILKKLIDTTQTIQNAQQFPRGAREGALIIIENEYGVKSFYEFHDGQWNEKEGSLIAGLLGNDSGTTYGNLFNYKVNAKEFNHYESDNFKYKSLDQKSKILLKIIPSKYSEEAINNNIAKFMENNRLKAEEIITIQLLQTDTENCHIVLSYRSR